MKKAFSLFCVTALAAGVWATTPNTITVDGSTADWAADELVHDDSTSDSAWGGNDCDNLYVTWDANNLYVLIEGTLGGGNTWDLWIDANDGSTMTASSGISWGKLFTFSGWNPDYVFHHSGGFSQTFSISDNSTSTDNNATWGGASNGFAGGIEWEIPFSYIGLQNNQVIRLAADISGGGYDGPDAMPDQTVQPNGDGNNDTIDQWVEITVADGSAVPLSGISPDTAATTLPVELDMFSIE